MLNEFRQDPVSGDWVLFATKRGKRPGAREQGQFFQTKEECLFEPERLSQQEKPVVAYRNGNRIDDPKPDGDWTTIVIPNKFPVVAPGLCSPIHAEGIFNMADGRGFHELVITRDHDRYFAQFSDAEVAEVLTAYRDRYQNMAADKCGAYIQIFHNHGHLAGATVYHNHSQILSMPIVPGGILKSMENCHRYFEKTGRHIHEELMDWEIKEQKRIIFENEKFIALCPYVSRTPYEIRIFPKSRSAYFEDLAEADIPMLAEALRTALVKTNNALGGIDYVFFIHTAPPRNSEQPTHNHYHWHIEILPRFSPAAGLELGANVFVNFADPDEAAAELRAAV